MRKRVSKLKCKNGLSYTDNFQLKRILNLIHVGSDDFLFKIRGIVENENKEEISNKILTEEIKKEYEKRGLKYE